MLLSNRSTVVHATLNSSVLTICGVVAAAFSLSVTVTASATSVLQQDFSTYPNGTYLSDAGWTMATHYQSGTGAIQITDTSGFAPANAVTGSTGTGRDGYIGAYRSFTSNVPAGSSLVLTSELYLRPNLEFAEVGFWDGTVVVEDGDPNGIYLETGFTSDASVGFVLEQHAGTAYENFPGTPDYSSQTPEFGPSITAGIYSVSIYLDAPTQTAWASVVAPDNQTYTSSSLALDDEYVAEMSGVALYVKNHAPPYDMPGSTQADFANINVDAVPEPASLSLLTLCGVTLMARRRKLA